MTDLVDILRDLAARGARLWVEQGQLRYLAPQGVIDAVVATQLRANREEVIALLVAEGCCWSAQPATEGQRAFWFLHQLASGEDTENTLLAVLELAERVESAAVRDALSCGVDPSRGSDCPPFRAVRLGRLASSSWN